MSNNKTHLNKQFENTLDRLLSKLGIASRILSQGWIRAGRVSVNNKIILDPDTWVSWPTDTVCVDHKKIERAEPRFLIFHKPCGYITTHSDENGRKTVFDLLPADLGFVHAVGRLDKATSGLLLLTNDTSLSSFLTEPSNKVPRTYLVTVWGKFLEEQTALAIAGVTDEGEHLKCDKIKILKYSKHESHLEVVLTQGKNREVRRLFKALGHEVTRLCRTEYGPFTLADLPQGQWREVSLADVRKLLGFF
jgi:23S rRNA pseudouridine2605 synthase